MVMKNALSVGEVMSKNYHHHHQYSSTPHLFVFQGSPDPCDPDDVTDDASSATRSDGSRTSSKEPIYTSAYEVAPKHSKGGAQTEVGGPIYDRYDTVHYYRPQRTPSYSPEDPLAVTEEDVARIETFFRGHLTQVWVCRTMANLYQEIEVENGTQSWQLRFTGVPLLLLDSGSTKSRDRRKLQLVIAEKGTGFALWMDVVDNLTSYRVQEDHFHTLYLSSDHRKKLGLSFNDGPLAMHFYSDLEKLTSDPANISLSGPGKKKKEKLKEKIQKYKAPKKTDISRPCNFNHVTNVDPADKTRFFSLQLFSSKSKDPTTQPVQPNAILQDPLPTQESESLEISPKGSQVEHQHISPQNSMRQSNTLHRGSLHLSSHDKPHHLNRQSWNPTVIQV